MGPYSWGTDHTVEKLLFEEGYRFEFYQAVKLLELLYPEGVSVGEGVAPGKEAVRFKSRVGLQFPVGDLSEIVPRESDGIPIGDGKLGQSTADPENDLVGVVAGKHVGRNRDDPLVVDVLDTAVTCLV